MLGALLKDFGYDDFRYVSGKRGCMSDDTWSSHAWLQSEFLIVDITADQFGDDPAKMVFGADSQWHKSFDVNTPGCDPDFRSGSFPGAAELHPLYNNLRKCIIERIANAPIAPTFRREPSI
ncbi:MAG: hypothetical protein JNM89_08900 [Hyphomicrobiaceae bacterium]|nr:hypothetical protein [Hyphomicrobiaceae bacterium]